MPEGVVCDPVHPFATVEIGEDRCSYRAWPGTRGKHRAAGALIWIDAPRLGLGLAEAPRQSIEIGAESDQLGTRAERAIGLKPAKVATESVAPLIEVVDEGERLRRDTGRNEGECENGLAKPEVLCHLLKEIGVGGRAG